MAVLCDIFQMSQNKKFDYWCIKSKEKMAEWLDLSSDTIYRAINTLKDKGYVESNSYGHLRCTQFIHNIESAQEEIAIYIKNNETEIFTAKMKEIVVSQNAGGMPQNAGGDTMKTRVQQPQNAALDSNKIVIENNNKNICATSYTFEQFWDSYGVKKNKHEAERKFNKLKASDKEHICAILPKFLLDTPDKAFRPHPTTFLNQKRWLD
jgi:Fe2+ or Zn2+ uptake regulation protein